MLRPRVGLLVGLLTIVVLISVSVSAAAQSPVANEQISALDYRHLQEAIRLEGTAQVIVEVALPGAYQLESTLGNEAAIRHQRQAILTSQQQVLDELAHTNAQTYYRYTIFPYLAMRIDGAALAVLLNSAQVVGLQEDSLSEPTLASSTVVIGAPSVWNRGFEGQGQTVVVLDTGIDAEHPFFGGRVVTEACFSNANGDGDGFSLCPNGQGTQSGAGAADAQTSQCYDGSDNLCYHGTHVAGIAAGNGNNFDGVARSANIIAIQVFTRFNDGGFAGVSAYVSDQLAALQYVTTQLLPTYKVAAINMSLGGGEYNAACDGDSRATAISNLRTLGVATVIASGNSEWVDALNSPGCITSAVTVGATEDDDDVAYFSNMHPIVDLLAPGVDIDSSIPGGGFASLDGTSMATPHVAGAWAVLRSIAPQASVDDLERILKNSGVSVDDNRPGGTITRPRIQLDEAIIDDIDILNPTTAAPGNAGPANNPQQAIVRVTKPQAGLALNRFAVLVGGRPAQLLSLNEESGAYAITVLPPTQNANGLYDVVVSVVLQNELAADKQARALNYAETETDLDPPQDFTATDGTLIAEVRLSWTKSDGATYYELYRSNPGQNNWGLLSTREGQYDFASDGQNIDGTVLDYAIKACSDDGCSVLSDVDSGYADMPQLNAIENSDGDDSFAVTWVPATTASSHDLQERHDSGSWIDIYSGSQNSVNQTGKTAGQWCYRVRAYNGIQLNSPWTSAQCTTVAENAPAALLLPLILSAPPPPPPVTALVNGNFEGGPTVGWTESSYQGWKVVLNQSDLLSVGITLQPHSGTWLAWLGGANDEISYVEQKVTIPAGTPYLSYWHWIASEDICGYDFGGVLINDSTFVDQYDLCEPANTGGWAQHAVDLRGYAGQTVELQIRVETDGSANSNLFVDDVSFKASAVVTTAAGPRPDGAASASVKGSAVRSALVRPQAAERLFRPQQTK